MIGGFLSLLKFEFSDEVPKNYFCHFSRQFDQGNNYKLDIQRYYVDSIDELIDIRMRKTSKDGEQKETAISNGMINFESENHNYNDYSMVDFPIRPSTASGIQVDIFVKNLLDTQRRTFSISISEQEKAFEVTRTTLFIAFGLIILCCVCSLFLSRVYEMYERVPN